MKIDISQKITGVDGIKPLENTETKRDLTLKDVCINAILASEQNQTEGKKKFEDFEIFVKLRDAKKEVDLSSEEISRIKEKGVFALSTLVMGQVWNLLEKKEPKK